LFETPQVTDTALIFCIILALNKLGHFAILHVKNWKSPALAFFTFFITALPPLTQPPPSAQALSPFSSVPQRALRSSYLSSQPLYPNASLQFFVWQALILAYRPATALLLLFTVKFFFKWPTPIFPAPKVFSAFEIAF